MSSTRSQYSGIVRYNPLGDDLRGTAERIGEMMERKRIGNMSAHEIMCHRVLGMTIPRVARLGNVATLPPPHAPSQSHRRSINDFKCEYTTPKRNSRANQGETTYHLCASRQLTMSLRRSARISTSAVDAAPEPIAESPAQASYTKVTKPTKKTTASGAPTTKKRKAKATTSPPTKAPTVASIFQPDEPTFAVPSLPATPLPKRRKPTAAEEEEESPVKPPPFTPTPSGVGLLVSSSELNHPLEDLARFKPRPADPHTTNAPLSTPGGSRVTAYTSSPIKPEASAPFSQQQETENASPSKKRKTPAKPAPPPDVGVVNTGDSTVDTLLDDAQEFLCKVDPKLRPLVEKHRCRMFSPEGLREVVEPFTALASGIMGQQVCGAISLTSLWWGGDGIKCMGVDLRRAHVVGSEWMACSNGEADSSCHLYQVPALS
jgi:hypothetical protein